MSDVQRLDKIISNFGFGTRREVKELVRKGRVKVDGIVAKDSGMHIDPEASTVEIDGKLLNYRKFIYIMLNKPAGVISATWDAKHKTVVDLMPEEYKCFDLFPVGRLDIDTEGLVVMTNDGQLAHDVLSPNKHVWKTYYALIEGNVSDEDVKAFNQGVMLDDGYKTLPAKLVILKSGDRSEIEITICEGKFHQVKRMFEAQGKKVIYLRRIIMGNLELDESLKEGESRELTETEVDKLKKSETYKSK